MSVEIRRASQRLLERGPGRATHHSFSFGEHYDPARLGLGPMVCHDDHRLSDGSGFEPHRHAGLDIVTWVLAGVLAHTDASGGSVAVHPGSVAVLRTGAGVEHAEVAAAPQTRFVQVWLRSDEAGEASYDVRPVALDGRGLVPVVELPDAVFLVARLETGESVALPDTPGLHVFVGRGALTRNSLAEPLLDGDAFEFRDRSGAELGLTVTAAVPTELLVWAFAD